VADAWLKGYLQASFRGVDFFIKSHKYQGGRRLAKHVFPEREQITYDDLGRKEDAYTLSAYIVAGNYFNQRNLLFAALKTKGPGTLVHPYLGVISVHCDSFSGGESTNEGRMVRFDLVFKEVSVDKFTSSPDTTTLVYEAKDNLLEAVSDWLDDVYDLARKPVRAIEDLNAALNSGLDVIDKVKKIANTRAEFKRALDNTRGKLIELQLSATAIAQDFGLLINYGTDRPEGVAFSATEGNAKEQYDELRGLTTFADEPVTDTPPEIGQDPDYPAYQIQQMVVYQAVSGMGGLMSLIPFDSAEDAEQTEDELFAILDGLLIDESIADNVYLAIRNLKAAIHNDLELRIVNLPRLVAFDVQETTNSLFLSNEIYGNITFEEDIIKRNAIEHPGFVPAKVPLKVKIDA